MERHGDFRARVYQEFARGFGVQDYAHLLHTGKANQTRLKTATEFARADQDGTLVRHALYATWRATETTDTTESLTWLRDELPNYHGPGVLSNEKVSLGVRRFCAWVRTGHGAGGG